MFYKKAVLKNFSIFTGKHLCWSLFSIKLQACNFIYIFIKKRLRYRCFPVNITNFLRPPILKNICKRLLLILVEVIFLYKLILIVYFCVSTFLVISVYHLIQKRKCIHKKEQLFFYRTSLVAASENVCKTRKLLRFGKA